MNMLRDMITGNDQELVRAKLTDIDETINDTAVDVFIYDTSKDSDGGAWRHRTQHTSWYAEASSASRDVNTRSTRAEFPAVAVIVAEADKVTIYDGDDPSLPMWRVTNRVGGIFGFWRNISNVAATAVSAKNGKVVFGINLGSENASGGCAVADYAADKLSRYSTINGGGTGLTVTQDATSGLEFPLFFGASGPLIVSGAVNDVAMTVLPDAPIDPATGLPVPTIAVATDGGVSVIKDDGTVVDYRDAATARIYNSVLFDNGYVFGRNQNSQQYFGYSLGSVDKDVADVQVFRTGFIDGSYVGSAFLSATQGQDSITSGADGQHAIASIQGLTQTQQIKTPANGMVAYTTSSYNTGWMNGDIKLAALADTTAETLGDAASGATVSDPNGDGVYDGEHVTNGDFATDTDWTKGTGWTISGGVATHAAGSASNLDQNMALVAGAAYEIQLTLSNVSAGAAQVYLQGSATENVSASLNSNGSYTFTLVAGTASSYDLRVNGSSTFNGSIDNVSVRLADPDRSVNGKGLAVHGSITKAPVATGADVVAYSGFDSSNYLEQPYNADLDFGAYNPAVEGSGDFCVMGWVKFSNVANEYLFMRRDTAGAGEGPQVYVNNGNIVFGGTTGGTVTSSTTVNSGTWRFFTGVRRSGVLYLYVDGKAVGSATNSANLDNTSAVARFGQNHTGTGAFSGSLALLRISATAPTADQIKKIYNDEKVLFQEGAKATLYGSSDAVTALAHDPDTGLLHVGTPGGRSVFQGLRRVEEHTGTNSQSLAAISAVDGLVVEGK